MALSDDIVGRIVFTMDETELRKFDRAIDRANAKRANATLGADVDKSGFREYERMVAGAALLPNPTVRLKADVDRNGFSQASMLLGTLGKNTENVSKAASNTAGAIAGMGGRLLGLPVAVTIAAIGPLVDVFASLTAGATALASQVGIASGALAALPGLTAALVQGFGTAELGFRGITDAVKALSEQQIRASEAARQKSEANAVASGNVATAERNLAVAQASVKQFQDLLNDSRANAIRQLKEMRAQSEAAALAEERASLTLKQAKERLKETQNDPHRDKYELADAELAVREAREAVDKQKEGSKTLDDDIKKRTDEGIEKDNQVVAAKKALRAAQNAVLTQQEALAKSQNELTKSGEALTQTQIKVNRAMTALSPAGRSFAKFIFGLRKEFRDLQEVTQEAFLPGIEQGIKNAMPLLARLRVALRETGETMGNTASEFGDFIGSKKFGKDFSTITEQNRKVIDHFGDSMLNLSKAFTNIMVAAGPFTEWLAQSFEKATKSFEKYTNNRGRITDFLEETQRVLKITAHILAEFGQGIANVFKAADKPGEGMLKSISNVAEAFNKWTGSKEGQARLTKWFKDSQKTLHELWLLMKALGGAFGELTGGGGAPEALKFIRTEILPAFVKIAQHSHEILAAFIALKALQIGATFVTAGAALAQGAGAASGVVGKRAAGKAASKVAAKEAAEAAAEQSAKTAAAAAAAASATTLPFKAGRNRNGFKKGFDYADEAPTGKRLRQLIRDGATDGVGTSDPRYEARPRGRTKGEAPRFTKKIFDYVDEPVKKAAPVAGGLLGRLGIGAAAGAGGAAAVGGAAGAGGIGAAVTALAAAAAPILAIGAAIAAVVVGLVALYKNFDLVKKAVKAFIKPFKEGFLDAWNEIKPALEELWKTLKKNFNDIRHTWAKAAKDIEKKLEPLKPIFKLLGDHIEFIFKKVIGPSVRQTIKSIGGFLAGFVKSLTGVINIIGGILTLDWKKVWKGMKQVVEGVVKSIKSVLQAAIKPFTSIGKELGNGIKRGLSGAVGGIKGMMRDVLNWIIGKYNAVVGAMAKRIEVGGNNINPLAGKAPTIKPIGKAKGGRLPGAPTNRDTIPAMLAPGETILSTDKRFVNQNIGYAKAWAASMGVQGFAAGGRITTKNLVAKEAERKRLQAEQEKQETRFSNLKGEVALDGTVSGEDRQRLNAARTNIDKLYQEELAMATKMRALGGDRINELKRLLKGKIPQKTRDTYNRELEKVREMYKAMPERIRDLQDTVDKNKIDTGNQLNESKEAELTESPFDREISNLQTQMLVDADNPQAVQNEKETLLGLLRKKLGMLVENWNKYKDSQFAGAIGSAISDVRGTIDGLTGGDVGIIEGRNNFSAGIAQLAQLSNYGTRLPARNNGIGSMGVAGRGEKTINMNLYPQQMTTDTHEFIRSAEANLRAYM